VSAFSRRARAKAVAAKEAAAKAAGVAEQRGRAGVAEPAPIEALAIDAGPQLAPSELEAGAEEPASGPGRLREVEPLAETGNGRRRSLAQRMRGWLGRAAS